MKIVLTGGAGYIGTHTAVVLLQNGNDVITVDNYSNSTEEALRRVMLITGKPLTMYDCDLRDERKLERIFRENGPVDCVIHFAGYKSVGESVTHPIEYYENNIHGTLSLIKCMRTNSVGSLIFSSSATVYGMENLSPCRESMPRGHCINPYGWTKWFSEQIIEDTVKADRNFSAVILRYFNPAGAHESGLIGEEPNGIPNNLMPYITQTAAGKREKLIIFGNDYSTPDGTCRRDFIHVMDLAEAHMKAAEYLMKHDGLEIFNIGTGMPYSVLEVVDMFQTANCVSVPYEFGNRREGDIPECWADVKKADEQLGWKARRSLSDMCVDAWNWQRKNPDSY